MSSAQPIVIDDDDDIIQNNRRLIQNQRKKEQQLKALLGGKFDILNYIAKQDLQGTQQQKDRVLRKRIIKFFNYNNNVKIDVSKGHFCEKMQPDYRQQSTTTIDNQIVLFGVDFLSTVRIRKMFLMVNAPKITWIDDSHCKVTFQDHEDAAIALKQNLKHSQTWKIKCQGDGQMQQEIIPRGWFELRPYFEMNFERRLQARYATSQQSKIEKKKDNFYTLYKKAKDQFERQLIQSQENKKHFTQLLQKKKPFRRRGRFNKDDFGYDNYNGGRYNNRFNNRDRSRQRNGRDGNNSFQNEDNRNSHEGRNFNMKKIGNPYYQHNNNKNERYNKHYNSRYNNNNNNRQYQDEQQNNNNLSYDYNNNSIVNNNLSYNNENQNDLSLIAENYNPNNSQHQSLNSPIHGISYALSGINRQFQRMDIHDDDLSLQQNRDDFDPTYNQQNINLSNLDISLMKQNNNSSNLNGSNINNPMKTMQGNKNDRYGEGLNQNSNSQNNKSKKNSQLNESSISRYEDQQNLSVQIEPKSSSRGYKNKFNYREYLQKQQQKQQQQKKQKIVEAEIIDLDLDCGQNDY